MADFARDLRGLMDALGIERAIVGGSSLGGIITAQFALDYPERVQAIIVGHTTPYFWDLAREWVEDLLPGGVSRRSVRSRARTPGRSTARRRRIPRSPRRRWAKLMASVGTGLGRDAESVRKMHRALLAWDQRPRYPELQALQVPGAVHRRRQRAAEDGRADVRVAAAGARVGAGHPARQLPRRAPRESPGLERGGALVPGARASPGASAPPARPRPARRPPRHRVCVSVRAPNPGIVSTIGTDSSSRNPKPMNAYCNPTVRVGANSMTTTMRPCPSTPPSDRIIARNPAMVGGLAGKSAMPALFEAGAAVPMPNPASVIDSAITTNGPIASGPSGTPSDRNPSTSRPDDDDRRPHHHRPAIAVPAAATRSPRWT